MQNENKETLVSSAPRHVGVVKIKKAREFSDIENQKQIDGVKTWSNRLLEIQSKSERISPEMKEAILSEIEKRKTK